MATQLATPLETKNKDIHTMINETKIGSKADPENIITITLDDLSKEDRCEFEQKLEKEMAEWRKLKLIEYQNTRNDIVKKVPVSSPSDAIYTKVKNSTKEIDHLVDVSVASKYGSDMKNTSCS